MNVLSGFDGMSCGQIALNRAGIKYDQYFASEVDKYAIKTSTHNFPNTTHLGSIVGVKASELPKIDLFMAGSPCQGFSNSGKGLNFEDPRSKLFFEFVRLLHELRVVNPDIKFLLENVRMKKEWEDQISRILEIQPLNINSALVSAQNRERLYWTNISMSQRGLFGDNYCTIPQPGDRGIFLKDILQPVEDVAEKYYISDKALARIHRKTYSDPKINPEKAGTLDTKNNSGQLSVNSGTTLIQEPREFITNSNGEWRKTNKALCIDANYFKGMDNHCQITMVREPIIISDREASGEYIFTKGKLGALSSRSGASHDNHIMIQLPHGTNRGGEVAKNGKSPSVTTSSWEHNNLLKIPQADRIYNTEGKSVTIGTRDGGLGAGTGLYNVRERIRRLTPIEVCRLQGVPDDYFIKPEGQIVSDSQIYKMCGNGWNVDTIVHILQHYE